MGYFFRRIKIFRAANLFWLVIGKSLFPKTPFCGNERIADEKPTYPGLIQCPMSDIGDLALVQTHPPEKCVRFTCQESGAHSFGHLPAIPRE